MFLVGFGLETCAIMESTFDQSNFPSVGSIVDHPRTRMLTPSMFGLVVMLEGMVVLKDVRSYTPFMRVGVGVAEGAALGVGVGI